jgi:type IV pilus assembly protein PilV
MEINQRSRSLNSQRGALMIEVLVAIVIGVIGLWGLMEMQARLQKSEMESYQRTQAMILVNDMATRIATNRSDSANYVTNPNFLGANMTCPATVATLQQVDSGEWCNALKGAAETQSGTEVGAMIGGRGCVDEIVAGDQYMVSVVWQGFTPISAPPLSVSCGVNLFDIPNTDCINDLCRRYVTTMVRIADL